MREGEESGARGGRQCLAAPPPLEGRHNDGSAVSPNAGSRTAVLGSRSVRVTVRRHGAERHDGRGGLMATGRYGVCWCWFVDGARGVGRVSLRRVVVVPESHLRRASRTAAVG